MRLEGASNPAQHEEMSTENLGQLQVALETQEARIKQLELQKEQAEARYEVAMKAFDHLQNERLAAQESLEQQLQDCQKAFQEYYQLEVAAEIAELTEFLKQQQAETTKALVEITEADHALQQMTTELTEDRTKRGG